MAIGDKIGMETLEELNKETLPQILAAAHRLLDRAEALVDRFDGATLTAVVKLDLKPPREPLS